MGVVRDRRGVRAGEMGETWGPRGGSLCAPVAVGWEVVEGGWSGGWAVGLGSHAGGWRG